MSLTKALAVGCATLLYIDSIAFAIDSAQLKVQVDKKYGRAVSVSNQVAMRKPLNSSSNANITASSSRLPAIQTPQGTPSPYSTPITLSPSDKFLKETVHLFGLQDSAKELIKKGESVDELGTKHIRYAQVYAGVPVYGSQLISHVNKDNEVLSVNGRALPVSSVSTTPRISSKRASEVAISSANSNLPVSLQNQSSNVSYRLASQPKLYFYNEEYSNGAGNNQTKLVWEIKLLGQGGFSTPVYLIDQAGNIVSYDSGERHLHRQIFDCSVPGSDEFGCFSDNFYAVGGRVYFFGRQEGAAPNGPNPFPAPYNGSLDVDFAYGTFIPTIRQYLMDKFGRDDANGIGGTGNGTTNQSWVFVHANGSASGWKCNPGYAWTNGFYVVFCAGSLKASDYDLAAHEYGHVVTNHMSRNLDGSFNSLLFQGEAGALNEHFSDIMGESFENYTGGGVNDWEMFVGSNLPSPPFRSLSNPTSIVEPGTGTPHPDRFYSPHYYCGTYDYGGIHHNSTVPSHAAYLASVGGIFNGCTIQGIGLAKVEQIWYRALTQYFIPAQTFNAAYTAFIQSCQDLTQNSVTTTSDCEELTKALQAVELDQPGACSGIPRVEPACAVSQQCTMLNSSFAEI
jgi:bacillolysin